jgi:hypothetical protein
VERDRARRAFIGAAVVALGLHAAFTAFLTVTGIMDGDVITASLTGMVIQVVLDVAIGYAFVLVARASTRPHKWEIAFIGAVPYQVALFLWDIRSLGDQYIIDFSMDDLVREFLYAAVVMVPMAWLHFDQKKAVANHDKI